MTIRLFLFVSLTLSALAAGCRDESHEPRSADEGKPKSKLNETHEDFKEGLHETSESVEEDLNKAHGKVKKGVKKAGEDLGVRDEVTGADSKDEDSK